MQNDGYCEIIMLPDFGLPGAMQKYQYWKNFIASKRIVWFFVCAYIIMIDLYFVDIKYERHVSQ